MTSVTAVKMTYFYHLTPITAPTACYGANITKKKKELNLNNSFSTKDDKVTLFTTISALFVSYLAKDSLHTNRLAVLFTRHLHALKLFKNDTSGPFQHYYYSSTCISSCCLLTLKVQLEK